MVTSALTLYRENGNGVPLICNRNVVDRGLSCRAYGPARDARPLTIRLIRLYQKPLCGTCVSLLETAHIFRPCFARPLRASRAMQSPSAHKKASARGRRASSGPSISQTGGLWRRSSTDNADRQFLGCRKGRRAGPGALAGAARRSFQTRGNTPAIRCASARSWLTRHPLNLRHVVVKNCLLAEIVPFDGYASPIIFSDGALIGLIVVPANTVADVE